MDRGCSLLLYNTPYSILHIPYNMRANTTTISNRMFKTQKIIVISIMSFLLAMMLVLSISYSGHFDETIGKKTSDRISQYFSTTNKDNVNEMANAEAMKGAKEQLDEMLNEPEDSNDI